MPKAHLTPAQLEKLPKRLAAYVRNDKRLCSELSAHEQERDKLAYDLEKGVFVSEGVIVRVEDGELNIGESVTQI
jgi:hypothetical protein